MDAGVGGMLHVDVRNLLLCRDWRDGARVIEAGESRSREARDGWMRREGTR